MYVGVTNDLKRRIYEHKNDFLDGFSKKYKTHMLVYYEETNEVNIAIAREKQMEVWQRQWKIRLINEFDPG